MKPQDALQLLDSIASQVQLSRADHVKVQQAVQVIRQVLPVEPIEEVTEEAESTTQE